MTLTPKTSPRMQRKPTSSTSSPASNASFNSYRSGNDSEEEDEVDSSSQLSTSSPGMSPTVLQYQRMKQGGGSDLKRRKLRPDSPDSSPSGVNYSPNKTPSKSDKMGGSPQSSTGSPLLYPSLVEELADVSPSGLYPTLDVSTGKKGKSDGSMGKRPRKKPTGDSRHRSPQKLLKMDSPNETNYLLYCLLAFVGLIILLIILYTFYFSPKSSKVVPQHELTRFVDKLQKLNVKFPAQNSHLWHTVSAATKRIINDVKPIQPAVILIGSSRSARSEADCLARHISDVVTEVYDAHDPISIDAPVDYIRLTPENAKIALDDKLRSGFQSGAKSAVISGLEEMHGDTAMLLHAFCDNDNAPFTKVVILFTLHVDVPELTDTRHVEDYLLIIWQRHINYDDVHALLSRVANNIVIAKKESDDIMKEHC